MSLTFPRDTKCFRYDPKRRFLTLTHSHKYTHKNTSTLVLHLRNAKQVQTRLSLPITCCSPRSNICARPVIMQHLHQETTAAVRVFIWFLLNPFYCTHMVGIWKLASLSRRQATWREVEPSTFLTPFRGITSSWNWVIRSKPTRDHG